MLRAVITNCSNAMELYLKFSSIIFFYMYIFRFFWGGGSAIHSRASMETLPSLANSFTKNVIDIVIAYASITGPPSWRRWLFEDRSKWSTRLNNRAPTDLTSARLAKLAPRYTYLENVN